MMENDSPKKISSNIILLGIVSFFNDVSSEMIAPILPMFLTALGGSGEAVGLLGGIRDSVSSLLTVVFGYLSDKTGKRKIFVYLGYGISGVFKLLLAISKQWGQAVAFSSLERTGKGLRTAARDAIIAESMPNQKGRGFGIHRAFDTAGAILGSVLAGLLIWLVKIDLWHIILIAGILSFVSLVPVIFVKEAGTRPQEITLKMSLKSLNKPLRVFILISGIFALGNFSYMFFVLEAQKHLTGASRFVVPIFLYVLFNIFYAAFAYPLGILSDKIGRQKVIIFGWLLFSISCFGFIFASSTAALVALFAVYGISLAAVDANQRALVSDMAMPQIKSTVLGTYHTLIGIAALPASLVAGFLWEKVGSTGTFIYGAVLGLMAVCLFIVFSRIIKSPQTTAE